MATQGKKKLPSPPRTSNEIRKILLQYFYDRNQNATSARGKQGFAIKISDIRREVKEKYGLKRVEVVGNLNYLMSQGWIEEEQVQKSVPLPSGTIIPQATSYFKITAAGIDKIDGPGEFTLEKFKGIKIDATGHKIITVGDGNQVNAEYEDAAGALVDLKEALLELDSLTEDEKLDVVADIDCIESQLAKAQPNRTVIQGAWEGVKKVDTVVGLASKIGAVATLLSSFLS